MYTHFNFKRLTTCLGIAGLLVMTPPIVVIGQQSPSSAEESRKTSTNSKQTTINGNLNSNNPKLKNNTYFYVHEFSGESGKNIIIDLISSDFDSYLIVVDPKNKKIAEDDDSGKGTNARVVINLPNTGTYKIIVSTRKAGEVGKYQLSWRNALPRDIELTEAEKLNKQVIQLYLQGKYAAAIPLAKRALAIRQKILGNNHLDVIASLNNLAMVYLRQGRYSEAEPLYQQSLEMTKRLFKGDYPRVALSLNNLAFLYERQGRYTKAEPFFQQALEMRKRLFKGDHKDVATSLNNLAALYSRQGRYTKAEPFYSQALEMTKRLFKGDHPHVAGSLNNLAFLHESQGRYNKAEPLYQQALEMRKRLFKGDHPHVADSLNNLAFLYLRQGKYTKAEPFFQQALEMRKQLFKGDHPHVATGLNNLAGLYESQGRYSKAEPLYSQALEMRKRLLKGDHPHMALSLNNLAALYSRQGRYTKAEPLYQQALEILKRLFKGDHLHVALSLNNLAALYESQGRYTKAEPLYLQALEMKKRLFKGDHPHVAGSLNNLAALYASQGRYTKAEPLYQQALNMRKRLFKGDHPNVADSLNNLAVLYASQGRYTKAESLYQNALEILKRLFKGDHKDVATSLNNLALLYESQGKINQAVEFLTQGIKVEETNLAYNLVSGFEQQKLKYIATISKTTDWAISLHLNSAPNNSQATRLALMTILQRKGRVLDFLTDSQQILRQRIKDPQSQELLNQLSQAHTQLSNLIFNQPKNLSLEAYRIRVAKLEKEAQSLQTQLSYRSQEFRTLSQPVTVETIQKLIPADTALVEIVRYQPYNLKAKPDKQWGKYRYAAYILSSQGEPKSIDLGEAEKIEEVLQDFRSALQDSFTPITQVKASGRKLDQIIMEPVRKLLGNTRKILISPDGNLSLIPFEALVDEKNKYLIENYAFTYLTSGRDLIRLQNPFPSQQPPVIIADPNFNRPGNNPGQSIASKPTTKPDNKRSLDLSQEFFPPLEGTREEALAIAPLLKVKPLLGKTATEAAIKQVQAPKVLHIATHGFFKTNPQTTLEKKTLNDNPLLLSGLVLAGFKQQSGDENGILSALETSTLNLLGTKLVVLSACDTGLGKVTNGEGVYNLRRALVIAGSESQVISLWKVADGTTRDLMKSYYQRLFDPNTNIGRTQALRETQLSMLQTEASQHPYYWAAFIPSGDWRELTVDG